MWSRNLMLELSSKMTLQTILVALCKRYYFSTAGGLLEDAPLTNQTAGALRRVLAPKAAGATALFEAAATAPVGATALFSSIAALLGNSGQANYGAANASLDALATELQAQVGCY